MITRVAIVLIAKVGGDVLLSVQSRRHLIINHIYCAGCSNNEFPLFVIVDFRQPNIPDIKKNKEHLFIPTLVSIPWFNVGGAHPRATSEKEHL